MKLRKYTIALAVCAIPAVAMAQGVVVEGGVNEMHRDGGDLRPNGEHREHLGAHAELNRNPYARGMHRSHGGHVVIVSHRHHHYHAM